MRRALLAVAGALLLLGAACSSDEGGDPGPPLEGTTWVLTSYDGPDVPDGVSVDLLLEDGKASGRSGCNSYGGSYETSGDQLTFGPLAATQMACPQEQMDVEAAYLAALERTAGSAVDGDELVLSDAQGAELLRFRQG